MGLLDGKKLLITGVLTDASLAFGVAELAIEEGAEVLLTGAGRSMSLTKRTARRLPVEPDVIELDVTQPEHFEALTADLTERWGSLDGVLHSIGFAPAPILGGEFLEAGWDDVAVALNISAYSLAPLARATKPLLEAAGGGSIVGMTFDGTVAWPAYDWMGVAKAALESTSRYLAREMGPANVRVNLVSAGPIRSMAAKSIPGFAAFEDVWDDKSPLGWDVNDASAVARSTVAMLSDWFPATTGEMIHVDGGYHAVGA